MARPVVYVAKLPSPAQFPEETVLFYDSILESKKIFKSWSRKFKLLVPLKSGENLKSIDSLNTVLKKITKLRATQSTQLTFVAVGGGSVGDFVGFLASVFLRGRHLIHIPSTWLAAVDSAHGGKNGLNFEGTKNQIGTFYPASKIYLCEELLKTQPPERLKEAVGEIVKTAILFDRKMFANLEKNIDLLDAHRTFQLIPKLVSWKYKIVEQDPFEKNGLRRILNLGHTMGHVFESHYGWPHGVCVLLGLQFSARWSFAKHILNEQDFVKISTFVESLSLKQDLDSALKGIKKSQIFELLKKDKKLATTTEIDFIFIEKIGQCRRLKMKIEDILFEVQRQKEF
jgi:3-dehydroquinate synthase